MNIQSIFDEGKKANLSDLEVFYTKNKSFSCKVFEQDVDAYSVSTTQGLSVRGIFDGKMGYTYTENTAGFNPKTLIETVINNAKYLEKEEPEQLFEGSESYASLSLYDESFEQVLATDKIEFLKTVERVALELDPRVKSVSYCLFADGESESVLQNTKGLNLSQKSNYAYTYLNVLVTQDNENKEASKFLLSTTFTDYSPTDLAKEIVTEALSKLKSKSLPSATYKTVLSNEVASDLLDAMSSCFSAESVIKKMSLLAEKCESTIASDCVTLVDDPHLPKGMASCSFDGEGVATNYLTVIESGVLKTYLHSLSTANKMDVLPTGHGMRASYKSSISISPTNFYIQPGVATLDALFETVEDGVYITSVQGLHAGLNTISGDFSLAASGYVIEHGKKSNPISEITISGNFFTLLTDITAVGNDLFFNTSAIGSPALSLRSLSISGE